ncbi:transglycosylase SLT domain-containing protein [Sulfitobacter sp.]|uniref:transglycosylase SLT domain-containing protein n=1 Tax=Sulfitobacter sp. TaxID=1903071 RepID=UPI0030029920
MKTPLRALIVVLLLASCGGSSSTPPRNLDNACTILKQRPDYHKAFKSVERKWGVPIYVQMATIHQESKFVSDARTPFRYVLGVIPMGRQSSAFGYSQALDATWDEYRDAERRGGARRNKIKDATDFMGWYMNTSRERNGIALSDARNQYLAYHEGHTGFRKGTYNSKPWLVDVAGNVEARSFMYRDQISGCRLR